MRLSRQGIIFSLTMKGSNIQPLFDNILIKPLTGEQKTSGGILLPESAKEKPQMGQVMAVGPGKCCKKCDDKKCNCTMTVAKGDKVLYKKWGGNEVKVQGEEWLIVEEKDILAIIK